MEASIQLVEKPKFIKRYFSVIKLGIFSFLVFYSILNCNNYNLLSVIHEDSENANASSDSQLVNAIDVKLETSDFSLAAGESKKIKLTMLPLNASRKTVSWESSDKSIASVDALGIVKANSPGEVKIKVTAMESLHDQSLSLKVFSYKAGLVYFNMLDGAPLASTFPTGENDLSGDSSINTAYTLGETEVTNELAKEILSWALENGKLAGVIVNSSSINYRGQELIDLDAAFSHLSFTNGTFNVNPGFEKFPVTAISWYGAILLCNWLSEMIDGSDNELVYSGIVLSWVDSDVVSDNNKKGFRFLTHHEWEAAARYIGNANPGYGLERPAASGVYWTPGNFASGATASIVNVTESNLVAWYLTNSSNTVKAVATRQPNGLGVYDMSGNCSEWIFTEIAANSRMLLGGSVWNDTAIQIGSHASLNPNAISDSYSFRLARNK